MILKMPLFSPNKFVMKQWLPAPHCVNSSTMQTQCADVNYEEAGLEVDMLSIYQIESREDRNTVRELFWEYLQWANDEVYDNFGVSFDIKTMLEEDMNTLDKFLPPYGRLLLAEQDGGSAGLGCLKKLKDDIGEIKRMYVRSEYRRKGIGKALLENLLEEASEIGYNRVWLDSARFMKSAHTLYRSNGFQEIEPYPESEIPAEFQSNWIFMEKKL